MREVWRVRPYLKPGVGRFWRDSATIQFGLDPDHAVVLTDIDPPVARFIADLTGHDELAASIERAAADGLDAGLASSVLRVLADAGVLDDADTDTGPLRSLTPAEREHLAPDLVARARSSRQPGSGLRTLRVRRAATVSVEGCGRVGAAVAALLASSGIGHLVLGDQRVATGADVSPAGLEAADVGQPRAAGVRRVIAIRAPSTRVARRSTARPDVVVVAPDGEPDRALAIQLVRDGVPHLFAGVRESVGVLGPLVVPGSSACLHCLDLHRTDIDPVWPSLLAQRHAAPEVSAAEVNLSTLVASMAVLHVLAFLDGGEPATIDGTLSIGLPDGLVRRRTWSPHPGCGCTWESLATPVGDPTDRVPGGRPLRRDDEGPDA